ncbi:TD and POZ domain-containing protein 1 [Argiope bruennichi]|uniref:TD and POZ domain-containing protein 1 n=1 Tax=Argiope bruennichi TaxID=94029 RepID=A0A8T0F1V9_ARGBR|nr:TD and POZ domain-containing protein 1 [Argiope bruennichi]
MGKAKQRRRKVKERYGKVNECCEKVKERYGKVNECCEKVKERCGKGFLYIWRIENFDYCWHKTGEQLESPLFHIDSSKKSLWRLWLYPRGEDDGEYISCFLFRVEGGPETVDVDFELSLSVGDSLLVPSASFLKIYLFKINEKEGEKCFIQRRKVFADKEAQKNGFTLTLGCRILNKEGDSFEGTVYYERSTIAVEHISDLYIFDDYADLDPVSNRAIEVQPLLEDDPLISINLSNFEENLTVKIYPKNCEKIKYAFCKILIVKNWANESPIEHKRFWIGKIKTDVKRYHIPLPETEKTNPDDGKNSQKTIFFRYEFAYTTGVEYSNYELKDCGTDLSIRKLFIPNPNENVEVSKLPHVLTVLNVLESAYKDKSFVDVKIQTKTKSFPSHKAFLCARSSKFRHNLKSNMETFEIKNFDADTIRRFLLFMYTDRADHLSWTIAIKLYSMADEFGVKLLKEKCRGYLESKCDFNNISELLILADIFQDFVLKAYIEKYIDEESEFYLSKMVKYLSKTNRKSLWNMTVHD